MYACFCIKEIVYDEFKIPLLACVTPIDNAHWFIKFHTIAYTPVSYIRTIIGEVIIDICHHKVIQSFIGVCYSSVSLIVFILNIGYEMCDVSHIIILIMI